MNDYKVTISGASRELSAREKIAFKDLTNAIAIDELTANNSARITPVMWALLDVHNPSSESKDYSVLVVVDNDGKKYRTGSQSFRESFFDIWDELVDTENGEFIDGMFEIEIYRVESKNYKGKTFITCSLV